MDSFIYTNVGGRSVNEDSVDKLEKVNSDAIYIVADGLGGHGKGEVASKLVVDSLIEMADNADIAAEEFFEQAVLSAQDTLMSAQHDLNASDDMKTTVVCLKICSGKAQWCHVGDTRLYMWRKNKLLIRTLDHSVPQMLVASGEIKEKQIRFHEDRNRLIRVLGTKWDTPKYDISEVADVESGDAFLLCTDGFWELITEREMAKCLKKSSSAQEWLERMVKIVNKRGAKTDMDNNTALGVIV